MKDMIEYAMKIVAASGEQLRTTPFTTLDYKDDPSDLVTDLDRCVESYIIEQLSLRYPDHSFLGEESRKEISDHMWIIDPIDGTTNFVNFHRDFTVSLAFYHKKQPVFGIVYDVMRDEMFVGVHGKGAWKNGKKMDVLHKKEWKECVLDAGLHVIRYIQDTYHHDLTNLVQDIRAHRSLGCASLSILRITQGQSDLYLSAHVKCWDYAAAIIILEEVKGAYTVQNSFFTTDSTLAIFANRRSFIERIQKEYLTKRC